MVRGAPFYRRGRGGYASFGTVRGGSSFRPQRGMASRKPFAFNRSGNPQNFRLSNRWNNRGGFQLSSKRPFSRRGGANLAFRRRTDGNPRTAITKSRFRGGGVSSNRGVRRGFRGRFNNQNNNQNNNNQNTRRGRGSFRGRGGSRGGRTSGVTPDKDSLDAQLDSYMGDDVMKRRLDRDLDSYFSNAGDSIPASGITNNTANIHETSMDVSMDGGL